MKKIFEGIGIALITPFKNTSSNSFFNTEIDYPATKKLLQKGLTEGASAIVILATTGEGTSITFDERKQFINFCKSEINGRAKLIVGTGCNNFETCLNLTQQAKDLGADGALVVTPYYNKTSQNGLVEYYKNLSKINIPIIIYNVPSRTGLNIEINTLKKIIDTCKNIVGIKECTTDILRITQLTEICKNKIAVYSGEDSLNYIFYCLGATGAISVTANVACEKITRIFTLCKQNKFKNAQKIQNEIEDLNKALFVETNPIPVKYLLNKLGYIKNVLRLPLVELSDDAKQLIELKTKEYFKIN